MSLGGLFLVAWFAGFPRVSGDEPSEPRDPLSVHMFSPRERG